MTEPTASGQTPPIRVTIRIESRCGEQRIAQQAAGDWYSRGNSVYIRYPETAAEYGRTTTTVKLEPSSVKIIRHGDIRSEQTFVAGERRYGYYETAQGRLELAIYTRSVRSKLAADGGPSGAVELRYELEVAGEPAGTYIVKLTIRKEAQP